VSPNYPGIRRALRLLSKTAAAPPAVVSDISVMGNMDTAHWAQPFVAGHTSASVSIGTMDYAFHGQPFVIFRKSS